MSQAAAAVSTEKLPRTAIMVAVTAATLGIIYGYDQSNIGGRSCTSGRPGHGDRRGRKCHGRHRHRRDHRRRDGRLGRQQTGA